MILLTCSSIDKFEVSISTASTALRRGEFSRLESLQSLISKSETTSSNDLILPRVPEKAEPSWFGFPITLKEHVNKLKFVAYLEEAKIETRQVFGGNILKQPGFSNIKHRISGDLNGTNIIMERTIFFGVYPGITTDMREYVAEKVKKYFV